MSFLDKLKRMMGSKKSGDDWGAHHTELKAPKDYHDDRKNSENSL